MHGSIQVVQVFVFGFLILLKSCVSTKHYTDQWAVHIEGGEGVAARVASRHGFIYKGQIMPDYYHFQHRKVAKRSEFASKHYHRPLSEDSDVLWVEQQIAKSRKKRSVRFNDPKWPHTWYLRGNGHGMNVQKAWEMGYTGNGVVVTILDDGIEIDHPDLKRNYDPDASYDVNGHDPDPKPRYDYTNENRHGTRCAGVVAAQANNLVCSVGVAYNAKIGGVRMLDGDVTDSVEAQSLGLKSQHIHIYSASWGPDDDGRTVDGPATLARKALYDGITKGRNGLGSIFVWASGNGGRELDNCNCDGYTNSIYTLSISGATEKGNIPWYSEACSSTLAATYSSGSGGEKQIVTTDLHKSCTETHTGTSASAPIAAGLLALALEANPQLSWRDLQHIIVETSKPDNLHADDWIQNGVGKKVSHFFGFGLMDAAAMVTIAQNWTKVPAQHICEIRSFDHYSQAIPMNGRITVPLFTDGCEGSVNLVRYLEHVQARITMTSSRRGEIRITLVSPSQTRSTLLAKRTRDASREGFNNWAFMTTHNWGEPAKGTWTLEIENGASSFHPVRLRDWVLVLYGTDSVPIKSPKRKTIYNYGNRYDRPKAGGRKPYYVDGGYDSSRKHGYYDRFTTRPPIKTTTTTTTTTSTTTPIRSPQYPWSGYGQHNSGHWPSSSSSSSSSSSHSFSSSSTNQQCKPGFFKMDENCVAHCPQHYFGSVQAVHLASPIRPNSTKPLLHTQGVCKPCHESCLTCKGSVATDCFQCASGYERKGEQCEKKMIWDLLDPDVMKHLAWAIILCIAAILLFSVVFGILQARDKGRLCWKSKTNYSPDWNKGCYDGVAPSYTVPDSDTETDMYQSFKYRYMTLFPQGSTFQQQQQHCSGAPRNV